MPFPLPGLNLTQTFFTSNLPPSSPLSSSPLSPLPSDSSSHDPRHHTPCPPPRVGRGGIQNVALSSNIQTPVRETNYIEETRSELFASVASCSSPVHGQGVAKHEARKKKAVARTAEKAAARMERRRKLQQQRAEARLKVKEEIQAARDNAVKTVLACIKEQGLTLGDFLVEVSNPKKWVNARNQTFFNTKDRVRQVLDSWVASKNVTI